jgi:hypothetical protein
VDDGTARAFGRVEAQLDQVLTEVSRIGRDLAKHEVRLDHVEERVDALESARSTDHRQAGSVRAAVLVSLTGVLASGVVTTLINVFAK